MSPAIDPRYTLHEAALELAKRECLMHGHDWRIIEKKAGVPVALICERCGKSVSVQAEAEQ